MKGERNLAREYSEALFIIEKYGNCITLQPMEVSPKALRNHSYLFY